MSHYHLEIIIPETTKVEADIEKILSPFSEHNEENQNAFYDWYVIGGRWSGDKIKAAYPEEALGAFYKELVEKKITVSGLQFGKQTISPSGQITLVDKIWKTHFPFAGNVCPLFDHYQGTKDVDICTVKNIPKYLSAARVIIAFEGKAEFMIEDSYWNGVDWVDSKWDGKVLSAIDLFHKKSENFKDERRDKVTPKDNWVCVTVDYHS